MYSRSWIVTPFARSFHFNQILFTWRKKINGYSFSLFRSRVSLCRYSSRKSKIYVYLDSFWNEVITFFCPTLSYRFLFSNFLVWFDKYWSWFIRICMLHVCSIRMRLVIYDVRRWRANEAFEASWNCRQNLLLFPIPFFWNV